jgi:hypothetical protein
LIFTYEFCQIFYNKVGHVATALLEVDGANIPVTMDTRASPQPRLQHGQQKMVYVENGKLGT